MKAIVLAGAPGPCHMAAMRHYPIFMALEGRTALVLGTGAAAERRAGQLAAAGASIRRAATFAPALLDGCAIAVGAEAAEADLLALAAAAMARGVPVGVVDRPELSSFITPSVIDRDPVSIAIGSSGTAPVLARLLRARIEALVPPAYGRLATFLDRAKEALRARFPDLGARRGVIEAVIAGEVGALVLAGREAEAETALAEVLDQDAPPRGVVFLVGAGPGAADLMTLRGQRLLGEADVVVHDRLVSAQVLALARRDAKFIHVGKARGHHCVPQAEINGLLVSLGLAGRRVVRLKGGDPFIFGRGGEEAEALRAAGVMVEIVPGVTAALACAAQAGIPLTHRAVARSLTFVTGHTSEGRPAADFAALARAGGTIAIYMGVATLAAVQAGLEAEGFARETPAALIENGGSAQQRCLFGTLPELVAQAPGWLGEGPALLLLGEAVGLSPGFRGGDSRRQGRPGALPPHPHRGRAPGLYHWRALL